MNNRDAKALGRWCKKHNRQHERIHFPGGAQMTGCPVCAERPELQRAMAELAAFVRDLPCGPDE